MKTPNLNLFALSTLTLLTASSAFAMGGDTYFLIYGKKPKHSWRPESV